MSTIGINRNNNEYKPIEMVKFEQYHESLLKNSVDIDEKFHSLSKKVLYSIREMKNESNKDKLVRSKKLLQLAKIENKAIQKGVNPQLVTMLENTYNNLNLNN
jgi:hypothetical protein